MNKEKSFEVLMSERDSRLKKNALVRAISSSDARSKAMKKYVRYDVLAVYPSTSLSSDIC